MEQKVTEIGVFEFSKDKYGGYLKAKKRKALSFFRRSMKSLLP